MSTRSVSSVFWQDGMFMWPHHMQQEDRCHAERLRLSHRWNVHHNWGLRALEWDADAFQSGRLEIVRLQARMRDGTVVEVPTEGRLPTLDLKELLIGKDQVRLYLAIAVLNDKGPNLVSASNPQESVPQAGDAATTAISRYRVEQFEVADENDGADPQTLAFRTLNLSLLVDIQDHTGYEVLEIAQFKKAIAGDKGPQLDELYIPPILACDAWKPVAEQILQMLYHHLSSRMDSLAEKALTRGITFETQNPGDNKLLGRLAVLNEATCVLNTLAFAKGVHPFTAYLELCRLVGQLAIFREDHRAPKLPCYDHDDLGMCFYRLKCFLEEDIDGAAYEERGFIGEGLRMQVSIEAKWLEPAWQLFVGIRSPLPVAQVIDLLTTPGELDMKIGSGNRVDQMFMRGIEGLEFTHASQPPRLLPTMPDLTYFQVNRESQQSEWAHVQESLVLAIRVNDTRLVIGSSGNLNGERSLVLKADDGHAAAAMQLSLFVVPLEATAS
jgi:type VI secretion system protein ImpJ